MLTQGEQLQENQATDIFFRMTKVFQSKHTELKAMVYLTLREMVHMSSLFIITNSLLKEIDKDDQSKNNALKVLPYVINQHNPAQSEILFKSVLMSKNMTVVNAALMASYKISKDGPDHVKKLTNEITTVLKDKPLVAHYHALNTLYNLKKNDMMSFTKVLISLTSSTSNYCSLTTIQLIRYVREAIESDILDVKTERVLYVWLAKQLNKTGSVVIEASKTMLSMRSVTNEELAGVVTSLNLFLMSSNNVNAYSVMKIIYQIAIDPARASILEKSIDLDQIDANLQNDSKEIRSVAISILLKVCKKKDVKKYLEKTLSLFTSAPEAMRIDVLTSCKDLSRRYPDQIDDMINFYWKCLRDKGEEEFKKIVVTYMEDIMSRYPNKTDAIFELLAEYIEDPLNNNIVYMIYDIFKEHFASINYSQKYLRFILNRLFLDGSEMRASSISCLGEIALRVPLLKDQVQSILIKYTDDLDDEVRERSYYYLKVLEGDEDFAEVQELGTYSIKDLESIQDLISNRLEEDVDFDDLINIPTSLGAVAQSTGRVQTDNNHPGISQSYSFNAKEERIWYDEEAAKKFSEVEELQELGPLIKSTSLIDLNEKESELYTSVKTHIFNEYLILEYRVKNNEDEHNLVNITVEVEFEVEDLKICDLMGDEEIEIGETGVIYVIVAKNPESPVASTTIRSLLRYTAQLRNDEGEVENEYEDEYNLEEYMVKVGDYMTEYQLEKGEFNHLWETEFSSIQDQTQKYQLNYKTVELASSSLQAHFGMSKSPAPENISNLAFYPLKLSGKYLGRDLILIDCQIQMNSKLGCVVQLNIKTKDTYLANNLLETLG